MKKCESAARRPATKFYILTFPLVIGLVFYLTFASLGPFLSDILAAGIHWWTQRFSVCLSLLHVSPVLRALIIDGICSGVGSVLSFLPIIGILFFCLSMLKTCGYMDLIASAMDGPLSRLGLSGAALIPLLTGFGCAVPAVMAAGRLPDCPGRLPDCPGRRAGASGRSNDSGRRSGTLGQRSSGPGQRSGVPSFLPPSINHRTLTIFMIPFLSCSARLPIYAALTAALFPGKGGLVIGSLYLLGIAAALTLAILCRLLVLCIPRTRADATSPAMASTAPGCNLAACPGPSRPASSPSRQTATPSCPANSRQTATPSCPITSRPVSSPSRPADLRTQERCPTAHTAAFHPAVTHTAAALRLPDLRAALKDAWENIRDFSKKAFTVIFLGSMAVWLLENLTPGLALTQDPEESLLAALGQAIAPAFAPLGFGDWRAASALIAGLSAKEAVVSTLAVMAKSPAGSPAMTAMLAQTFTPQSAYAFMTFCLLYIPCIATLATVKKEMGSLRHVIAMIALQIGFAWIFSFLLYHFGVLLE